MSFPSCSSTPDVICFQNSSAHYFLAQHGKQCRSDCCEKQRFFKMNGPAITMLPAFVLQEHASTLLASFSPHYLSPRRSRFARQPRLDSFVFIQCAAQHNALALSKLLMTPSKLIYCRLTASARVPSANCRTLIFGCQWYMYYITWVCTFWKSARVSVPRRPSSSRCIAVRQKNTRGSLSVTLESQRCCSISSVKYWWWWNIHERKLSNTCFENPIFFCFFKRKKLSWIFVWEMLCYSLVI